MAFNCFLSLLVNTLNSISNHLELLSSPYTKSIPAHRFPKLHSDFIHTFLFISFLLFISTMILDLLKPYVPQRFCNHVFHTIDKSYFSFHIHCPLLKYISSFVIKVVAIYFLNDHFHCFLHSIIVNFLLF